MGHFPSAAGVWGLVCLPISISSICELQRNFAIEWRYLGFLIRYRYGSIEESNLIVLYVLKMGFNCKSCIYINQVDTKLFLTMCLQLLVNDWLSSVMSKSMSFTSFTASVAQFVNRWLLKFFNSEYTLFANLSSDILLSRFMKHKTDMWHAVFGGSLPYSPKVIVLLVVALIHSIHRAYYIIVIDKLRCWCQRLAWFIYVCLFYRDKIFYTPSSIQWKSDICNTTHNSNTIHDLPILASRVWRPLEWKCMNFD